MNISNTLALKFICYLICLIGVLLFIDAGRHYVLACDSPCLLRYLSQAFSPCCRENSMENLAPVIAWIQLLLVLLDVKPNFL